LCIHVRCDVQRQWRTLREPLFVSIQDSARLLSIGRSKLYELVAAGELTVRKLGRKSLIAREDLTSFAARLAAGRGKAESAIARPHQDGRRDARRAPE